MDIITLLKSGKPIVADGGMGSMLISMGLVPGNAPELWNVEQPGKIRSIHDGYIAAGAQTILTNTFGGTRPRLENDTLGDRTVELNRAGAAIARAAADAVDRDVFVGGSIGPTGQFFEPMGTLTLDEGIAIFEEQAKALVDGGVDILWIETMSDLQELTAAVEGCKRAAPETPVFATMTFDTKGRTMMGTTPEQAVKTLAELGVAALGANCGNGPDEIEDVITAMRSINSDIILIAKSNAGLPQMVNGKAVYDATPEDMAAYANRVREKGATIIGACCGSNPDHIKAIAGAIRK